MLFPAALVPGQLIKRYKRFLADVALADGTRVTAHCANSGSMLGLNAAGNRVWLLPKKGGVLDFSWEIVEVDFGRGTEAVGINTMKPNRLAEEAILAGSIPALAGYALLRREVRYGVNSRVDLLLEDGARPKCFVEVKNVHLCRRPGLVEFPDCVTARGTKHLAELEAEVAAGNRAVMLFVIQMAADAFSLATDLDPAYARAFGRARSNGVEALAYACTVSHEAVVIARQVPILDA